ncbi:MAG: Hsp20/alpha crystallin family protein [Pirellulaceae bacterium]
MNLKKWEPLREMDDLLDRYVRVLGWPAGQGREQVATGDWMPKVDISETDAAYSIHAELPAIKPEDVKVTVENGVLTIKGERKQESEEKGRKFHRVERSYGSFIRSFSLPESVDAEAIAAHFEEGVLNLSIPKVAKAVPKAIEIQVGKK